MDSIPDILQDANTDIKTILKYKTNNYFRNLMVVAYMPTKKMLLPEGNPPFKTTGDLTDQITKGAFWQICRKLDIFLRSDISAFKRESAFIHALESVSTKEAQILLKAKDQALTDLYPNLTYDKLKEIGYF